MVTNTESQSHWFQLINRSGLAGTNQGTHAISSGTQMLRTSEAQSHHQPKPHQTNPCPVNH